MTKMKISSQVGKTYKMGHNSLLYPEKKITKLLYSWEAEVCKLLGLTVEQELVEHRMDITPGWMGMTTHHTDHVVNTIVSSLSSDYNQVLNTYFKGLWPEFRWLITVAVNFQYIFTLTVNLISNFNLQHFPFL